MLKVAVLVSGGGTNLQALIDAKTRGEIPHAEISLVVSSRADAGAIGRAQRAGIETAVLRPGDYGTKSAYADALAKLLTEQGIGLIVLAGFLVVLPRSFTDRFEDKIINVHPSLIPSFCGQGYYGLKVHEAALDYGVKITGATVHIVNEEVDGGRILLQKAVAVEPGDTPKTLQRRVMEQAEWVLLPRAVAQISEARTQ